MVPLRCGVRHPSCALSSIAPTLLTQSLAEAFTDILGPGGPFPMRTVMNPQRFWEAASAVLLFLNPFRTVKKTYNVYLNCIFFKMSAAYGVNQLTKSVDTFAYRRFDIAEM